MGIEFVCPKCSGISLEEVMVNVTVSTNINDIDIEDGEIHFDYGEQSNEDGVIESYQCMSCGHIVATSQEELIEVIEEIQEQQRRDEKNGLYPEKTDIAN